MRGRLGRLDGERQAAAPLLAARRPAELAHDPGEHPRTVAQGSWTYPWIRTSSPIGRDSRRASASGARKPGEHPRPVAGELRRDEDEQLVDEICSRNAAASVGPPSRRSDWTPSAASASSSSRSGSRAQLELGAVRQRPAAEREPARLPDDGHVAGVESRVLPAHRSHSDRDGVGLRPQHVHEPPRRFAGDPARAGHPHAAVERDRDLVGDERPSLRDPRPPLLDLLTAAERELAVGELDLDSGGPEPVRARRRAPGSDRAGPRRHARRPPRAARRRTAA